MTAEERLAYERRHIRRGETILATKTLDMTLPVFPNGYARQTVCACDPKMIIPARTMIDGKWRLVCMTCGSLNINSGT
jgi:hypothetical protein